MAAAPIDTWQRLATAVATRRNELGLTQAEAVAAAGSGISPAVWSILEGARQKNGTMSQRSLRAAAKALGWPSDALIQMLDDEAYVPEASARATVLDAIDADPDLDETGRDTVRRVYLIAKAQVHQP